MRWTPIQSRELPSTWVTEVECTNPVRAAIGCVGRAFNQSVLRSLLILNFYKFMIRFPVPVSCNFSAVA